MWFRNLVFKKGFILNFTLNYDERLDFLTSSLANSLASDRCLLLSYWTLIAAPTAFPFSSMCIIFMSHEGVIFKKFW